jgi:hypothetical protein
MQIHDQKHIIEKQIVELITNNQEVAKDLQNLVSAIVKQKVIPEIEKICNKYADHNTIIRLDQLELDLGILTLAGFETEFFESSVQQFEKKIDDIASELVYQESLNTGNKTVDKNLLNPNKEGKLIQKQKEQLEVLQHFLETGQIPWYQQQNKEFSISRLIHQVVRESPDDLFALLKQILGNKNILHRFIYQFDDQIKQLIFNALYKKTDSNFNEKTVEAILNSWKPDGHLQFSQNRYNFIVWHTIYNELINHNVNQNYFVVNLIFAFLKEIIRTSSSVERVLVFLTYFRKEVFLKSSKIKSKALTALVTVADTFMLYIIHKLSEGQDIEKNLRIHNQLTNINGKKITIGYQFKKQINEQFIIEIKKLIENSGFASIENLKTELLTKGKLHSNESWFSEDNPYRKTSSEKPEEDNYSAHNLKSEKQQKEKKQEEDILNKTREKQSESGKLSKGKIENDNSKFSTSDTSENENAFSDYDIFSDEFPSPAIIESGRKKPFSSESKKFPFGKVEKIEQIYIQNAGLSLVWPYLPALFNEQGLLTEKQQFKDFEHQLLAIAATHYLVYGNYEDVAEYELSFNKLLCGLEMDTPIPILESLPDDIQTTCDEMLTEAVQNWTALKNSTINGLRTTFLQREGKLSKAANGWKLYIERLPFDVLMERLPWSIAVAVLPWSSKMIYVEW